MIVVLVLILAGIACNGSGTEESEALIKEAKNTQAEEPEPEIVEATKTETRTVETEATTETEVVEEIVAETMYVCGMDRCVMSGAYGELLFVSGINVWENPDPNRGKVIRTLDHLQAVTVLIERRVSDGSGGLWYQPEGGGWINDLWLTEEACTTSNLEQYSLDDC